MSVVLEDSSRVNLDEIPLCVLSASTRNLLSSLLNTKKLILSDDNYLRDWRGLAQLARLPAIAADSSSPTDSVINAWSLSANEDPRPTVGKLLSFLGQIDRWDVFDDVKENMVNDAKEYLGRMSRPPMLLESEGDIITIDDLYRSRQGLPLQKYDAFFLFVDEDAKFAYSIIESLEKDYNLRLCLRDRDLVPGVGLEHSAIMRLIASRCSHLIAIISKDFISSGTHKFFFKYAEALAIEQGTRKVVPCVYNARMFEVPSEFRFYFLLDFSRSDSLRTFCNRLSFSIGAQLAKPLPAPPVSINVSEEAVEHRCTIEEISSEPHRLSTSSSTSVSVNSHSPEGHTQVVPMPDPSVFLSPEKNKLDFEASAESSSMSSKSESKSSKPVSPVFPKIRNIFKGSKSSSSESEPNRTAPKAKKKNNWFSSKKKIAVSES